MNLCLNCFLDVVMIQQATENVGLSTEDQLSGSASTSKSFIELTPVNAKRTPKKMVSPRKRSPYQHKFARKRARMGTDVEIVSIQKSIREEVTKIAETLEGVKNEINSLVCSVNNYTSTILEIEKEKLRCVEEAE